MGDVPDDMDLPPINEWIADQLATSERNLKDLMRRHEEIVNHLADVCRRNDRMQAAGNLMRDILADGWGPPEGYLGPVDAAIQQWGEANI